jgi:transposase
MNVATIGIDVGKIWYHVVAFDERGAIAARRRFNRGQLLKFMERTSPSLVGMEACCGSHHLARDLIALGHDARLMAAKFVRPFLKGNKNDYLDAEAIAEAVQRPTMRFVPVKTGDQLDLQAIHRVRSGLMRRRTGLINQVRSFLQDRGINAPAGPTRLARALPDYLDGDEPRLSGAVKKLLRMLREQWRALDAEVAELEEELHQIARVDAACSRLATIPGIGLITATAIVAAIGDGRTFRTGRDFAAWLGLVPRQHSTGGRSTLLGISKRGNSYIRTLLIHGSRCMLRFVTEARSATGAWAAKLAARTHPNVAAVALANKQARIAWAVLTQNRAYEAQPA